MARKMKGSGIEWIGEIPAEWEKNKVFRIFGIIGSGTTPKFDLENEKTEAVYWIQSGDINGGIIVNCKNKISHNLLSKYSALKIYKSPFIVLAMYGASIGNISISQVDACVNQACCVLGETKLDFSFSFYVLKAAKKYLLRKGIGGGQPNISQDIIRQIWLPVPPIVEQQRIADFLDQKCAQIDEILQKTRDTIAEYKKLKQSIITQAVTKGVRCERPMKDSGIEWIGEIPEEWEVNTIFQLFMQIKNKNIGLKEQNLLSLSYGKIKRKNINTTKGLLPDNFEGYNIIENGDIVLRLTDLQNDHRSLRVGLSTEKGIVTSAYVSLRGRSNNISKYLYYYLHSFDVAKGFYGMGAGVRQGLNWDGIKWLKITIPSVLEQQEIAAYLDQKCAEIDKLIEKKEQFVNELESYKKSLIYEYVTGKKEVL